MKKISTKLLCVILSVTMLIMSLPMYAFAIDLSSEEASQDVNTSSDRTAQIIELTDRRTSDTKHFKLEDGSYYVAQYQTAVHYLDEDGNWQDIDNTLAASGSEISTSNAKIKFVKKTPGNGSIFTLHDGNRKLELTLDGAEKKVEGQITNHVTEHGEDATELQKMTTLDKVSASVLYADILPNTDLEYIVNGLNIKENIIVKAKGDAYSYSFTMSLNNLNATLNAKGEILITDSSSGNTVYTIPAPIMWDAADTVSDAVTMSLASLGNGKYTLTVTADSEWMNATDRVYPVTIDPPIYTSSGSSILDLNIDLIDSEYSNASSSSLMVGEDFRTFWKIEQSSLPSLPSSAYVTDAEISFTSYTSYSMDGYVAVYEVISDWDDSLTAEIWADDTSDQANIASNFTDYLHIVCEDVDGDGTYTIPGGNVCTWNITPIVKKWYANANNNCGIMLAPAPNTTFTGMLQLRSNDYTTASVRPQLCIKYQDMKGIEDYWSYSSQSAGFAGTGSINNATGNLVFSIPTLTSTDALMPVSPALVYNSAFGTGQYTYTNSAVQTVYPSTFMPKGFKLNLCESLIEKTYLDENGTQKSMYVWADGDGTEHYFMPTSTAGTYKDEDGMLLTLVVGTSSCTITDDADNVKTFSKCTQAYMGNAWYLTSIADSIGNKVTITTDSYYRPTAVNLVPVGGSAIEQLRISYGMEGIPYAIWNPNSGEGVIFRYKDYIDEDASVNASQYLAYVLRAHGSIYEYDWETFYDSDSNYDTLDIKVDAIAEYNYDSTTYLLNSVTNNLSQYRIDYTYDSSGRITGVSEYATGENGGTGQQISLTYGTSSTVIRTSGSDDIFNNSDDLLTTYGFDSCGRTVSCYTTDLNKTQIYGASNGQYVGDENEKAKNNLKSSVQTVQQSSNYLLNGNFEAEEPEDSPYWNYSGDAFVTSSGPAHGNFNSALLRLNSTTTTSSIYQYVWLDEGEYTLSTQIDTANCENVQLYLKAKSVSNSEHSFVEEISVNEFYATGTDVFANLNFTSNPSTSGGKEQFKITIEISGTTSNAEQYVEVDNVMLSRTIGAAEFDYVTMGHFDATNTSYSASNFWSVTTGSASIVTASSGMSMFGKSLYIRPGTHLTETKISQVVYQAPSDFKAAYIDDYYAERSATYVLSGWGKGTSQTFSDNGAFELSVEVKYYNPTNQPDPETYTLKFDKGITDWQFAALCFATDATKGMVDTITVTISYYGNPGGGYFDNISLVRDYSNASVYSYNAATGYMESATSGPSTTEYVYDSNGDVIYAISYANQSIVQYTYNDYHQVIGEKHGKYTGALTVNHIASSVTGTISWLNDCEYLYNDYGLMTTSIVYDASDYESYVSTSVSYNTSNGSHIFATVASETDSLGNITNHYYDSSTGRLLATIYPEGNGLCYEYDAIGNLTRVLPANASETAGYVKDTLSASVGYNYTNDYKLLGITTLSTQYNFTYDAFGNTESISVGDTCPYTLATYTYAPNNGKLQSMTYGNGLAVKYVYDALDRISQIQYNIGENGAFETVYSYEYDSNGNLYSVTDHRNSEVTMYKYDAESKLIKSYVYDSETMTNSFGADVIYDLQSRVSSVQLTFDYVAPSGTFFDPTSYTYTYSEEDDTLSQLMIIGGGGILATIEPVYDRFGRTTSKVIDFNLGNANAFYNELSYDYKTNGYKESGLVSQLISKVGQTSTGTLTTTTYNYTYDDNGNITQITDASGVIQNKYTYDDLGQLTREDNRALNKSYAWTYDNAGNILSKKTYAFTTGTLGTALDTIYYSYKDSEWWDLLIEYEGVEIVYDLEGVDEEGIGNPIQIGEYSLTWEGRQLKSFANPEMYYTINYTYNSDGVRTAKEVRDDDMYDLLLYEYTLNGTQIVKETVYNDTGDGYTEIYTLVYIYDETGAPIGMKYRTPYMAADTYTCFFFEKNMQGDIVSVYNSAGVKVIAYTYDAWGNFTSSYPSGTSAASIARYNPFRYRGYYYDTETEFYYLQSRYYNPEWGRFLNADAYINANGDIVGFNLFAYCSNNPITFVDDEGTRYMPFDKLSCPGEIHKAVINHILSNYPNMKKEVYLTFFGRADIVNVEHHHVYEVKPVTYNSVQRKTLATDQLMRYVFALNMYPDGDPYVPGTEKFDCTFPYKDFYVHYWLAAPGLIFYSFYDIDHDSKKRKKSFSKAESEVAEFAMAGGALTAALLGACTLGGILVYTSRYQEGYECPY